MAAPNRRPLFDGLDTCFFGSIVGSISIGLPIISGVAINKPPIATDFNSIEEEHKNNAEPQNEPARDKHKQPRTHFFTHATIQ